MPTYATLFTHTDHEKQNIETIPHRGISIGAGTRRRDSGEMQTLYYGGVGEYDGIAIADFPDGEAVEQFRLAFEREGTYHFEATKSSMLRTTSR